MAFALIIMLNPGSVHANYERDNTEAGCYSYN